MAAAPDPHDATASLFGAPWQGGDPAVPRAGAAAAPPLFQRAPRFRPEPPGGTIEIPAPPPAPAKQEGSLLPVLLPAAFGVVSLVVLITTAAENALLAGMSGGMMVLSSLTSLLVLSGQKRAHRRAVAEREEKYRALLEARRQELAEARRRHQEVLCQLDPDPGECALRVTRRPVDRRLWERGHADPDFLSLRLGIGSRPLLVTVKTPPQPNPLEADPLVQAAQELGRQYAQTPDVPVCLPLGAAGLAGVAGPRPDVLETVRALVLQIATHHPPDEVKIVAVYPAAEQRAWDWLKWLPHVWTDDRNHRYLACEAASAHALLDTLCQYLNLRSSQAAAARDDGPPPAALPRFVLLFADPSLIEREPIVRQVLTEGRSVGAYPVFLSDRRDNLPPGCHTAVEVGPARATLYQAGSAAQPPQFVPDRVPAEQAQAVARAMAPIRLKGMAASTEVPRRVDLLDALDVRAVEELDVLSRWRAAEEYRSLAAPIGRRAGGVAVDLDLHERGQGPHGLVAGKTGSGKTELLQSLIATLAANYHPHQVSFVLIDYKGGGMANPFLRLPHLVGTITNLQGSLAMRALAALRAEIHRREILLGQAGVQNIYDYQKAFRQGSVREPLPHLVIIADEFAELKSDQPDFMKQLVSAARVGRGLGIHLILATQKPAGVVDEQIWANSSFRICMKVERPEDSQEVLKQPDAAGLEGPGQAYFQFGVNPLVRFQSAYAGADYVPGGAVASDPLDVVEVALDGSRRSLRLSPKPLVIQKPPSQLQALVAHLRQVADAQGIPPLKGPWLPPLPEEVTLDQVRPPEGWDGCAWQPAQTWLEPVIGLLDDPANSYQGPARVGLSKEGHLAVYGAPGSGKAALLQTLVTSLALTHSPQDLHLYLLAFGGRLLKLFEPLPHVGGVILADEAERLDRLLRMLLREIESRKQCFAQAGVNLLPEYRRATDQPMPAIVVVLDNYAAFATTYPDAEDQLAHIAREGGNLGIHLVLTAGGPSAVKVKISGSITQAVALQLADRTEYGMAVGRTMGLEPAPVFGRGLIKGNPPLEFQTALPTGGDTEAARTAALKRLLQEMARAWGGPGARPVPMLPDVVPLCSLVRPGTAWPPPSPDGSLAVPVGLDVEDLEPLTVDLNDGPHFLITGPVHTGKTTFLQSWLLALADRFPPERLRLYLVDLRRGGLMPFQGLPQCRAYVTDDDLLGQALAEIAQELRERRQALDEARRAAGGMMHDRTWLARFPALVLAMDDLDAVRDEIQDGTAERLETILRRERGLGFHLLLAGSSNDLSSAWSGWIKAIKELQTGFLLGSSDHSDLQLLNLRLPPGEAGSLLPPGLGFYGRRGRCRKLKAATCQAGAMTLIPWLASISQRRGSP